MNRHELIRRINEALDSPDGLEGDLQLQRLFARDPAASDLADELARIDRALRKWPTRERTDDAWEALAMRIEQRLDDALPAMREPTSRPVLEDEVASEGGAAELGESPAPEPTRPVAGPTTASGEFSLSLLTKMAGGPAAEESADGEDRFSFTDVAPPPPRPASGAPKFIDPVAPAPAQRKPRKSSGLYWIGGAFAAAAVALIGLVVGLRLGEHEPDAMAMNEAATPSAPAAEEASPSYELDRSDRAAWSEEPAQAAPVAAAAQPEPDYDVVSREAGERRQARLRREPPAPSATVSRERSPTGGGGAGSPVARPSRAIETPLEEAAGGGATVGAQTGAGESASSPQPDQESGEQAGDTTEPEPEAVPPDLPATPSRDDVLSAMRGVQGMVEACAQERHGVATVEISVGSSGRVRSALVTGDLAGTPEGSCVARAVRRATFPRFTDPTFDVTFPFQL